MSIYFEEFLNAKATHEGLSTRYGLTAVCRGTAMWELEKSKAVAGKGQIYTVPSSIALQPRCH
jgi:hypothetical protein